MPRRPMSGLGFKGLGFRVFNLGLNVFSHAIRSQLSFCTLENTVVCVVFETYEIFTGVPYGVVV